MWFHDSLVLWFYDSLFSMIMWFCDSMILWFYDSITFSVKPGTTTAPISHQVQLIAHTMASYFAMAHSDACLQYRAWRVGLSKMSSSAYPLPFPIRCRLLPLSNVWGCLLFVCLLAFVSFVESTTQHLRERHQNGQTQAYTKGGWMQISLSTWMDNGWLNTGRPKLP